MLSNTIVINEQIRRGWFQEFKNSDVHIEDRHSGVREKVFKEKESRIARGGLTSNVKKR